MNVNEIFKKITIYIKGCIFLILKNKNHTNNTFEFILFCHSFTIWKLLLIIFTVSFVSFFNQEDAWKMANIPSGMAKVKSSKS